MRDLIRLSEEELQELTTPQRLRMFVAIGVSLACGIVSLQGMAALFTDATVVPLPGMQHTGGQIAWAAALVAMLILVTFLIRGVIKRRLQWAIGLSLLLHFLLCLSMTTVAFRGLQTRPAEAADFAEIPRDEFSLPDYAGMEQPSVEKPWEKTAPTETPEKPVEIERPEMQLAETVKPESPDSVTQQQAQEVETPERQDRVEISADVASAMERQATDAPPASLAPVAQPDVTAAASDQAQLDAKLQSQKMTSELASSERQQQDAPTTAAKMEAADLQAQRSDAPATPESIEAARADRNESQMQATESPAENLAVTTSNAARMNPEEQDTQLARRTTEVAANRRSSAAPAMSPATAADPLATLAELERAPGAELLAENLPEDGGSVAIARNATGNLAAAGNMAATGEVSADSVTAAEAAGSDALAISESANSRSGERGTAASVPKASMISGSPGNAAAAGGSPAGGPLKKSNVAASGTGKGRQPKVGDGSPAPLTVARGTARQAGAVGAEAKVSGRGGPANAASGKSASGKTASGVNGSPNNAGQLAGPAKASIGRQSSGLPSSNAGTTPGLASGAVRGKSTGQLPSGLPSAGVRVASGGTGGVRGTEPSAKLNPEEGLASASPRRAAMSRSSSGTSAGLPAGSLEAEEGGELVFAGPQSAASGTGGISGPRVSSLPRRSAGLPGSNGPAGLASNTSAAGSQPGQVSAVAGGSRIGSSRPKLASADSIAGLVKRSAAGSAAAQASIPESLSMRTTDARREAAKSLGGSELSEEAVERGLEWLSRNQYPDGHWSIDDFPGETSPTLGEGSFKSNSAATGLALLAYLGAGYTHQSGKYQENVKRGMTWLLQGQKSNGDLFSDETEFVWFYSHGIASIAVCEAYGLTKDAALKDPAQKALNFIVASQHPKFGGWRYRPQFESDTSVSGWQLMALKSGEMAGLDVSPEAYVGVRTWLDSVQSKTAEGQYSYHPSSEPSSAMTAEALLMRQYLGAKRNDPRLIAGANFLATRLPDFGQRDSYYWYYATQVMFHMQGEYWSEWNAGLRDLLVTTQTKGGAMSGSWDPARPTPEKWAGGGGRHYLTCVNLLMLEVYYRHLPLYLELEK